MTMNSTASGTPAVVSLFVYDANGGLAAEYKQGPAFTGTRFVTADHLGSKRLMFDTGGAVTRRYDYQPFGAALTAGVNGRDASYSDTSGSPRFTGQIRDVDTGLDYFGARHLASGHGRFTAPDGILVDQNADSPQSWNLYQYGYNNPLNNVDLDGRSGGR